MILHMMSRPNKHKSRMLTVSAWWNDFSFHTCYFVLFCVCGIVGNLIDSRFIYFFTRLELFCHVTSFLDVQRWQRNILDFGVV